MGIESRRTDDGYVAHTPAAPGGSFHLLWDHLEACANVAARFGEAFGMANVCRALGLAHDLGKANPAFQQYLRDCAAGKSAKSPEHSAPGAAVIAEALGPFALCIMGHHSGLPAFASLKLRLRQADPDAVAAARELAQHLQIPSLSKHPAMGTQRDAEHLVRMCFSALVDADFLDTESHFSPGTPRGGYPSIGEYRRLLKDKLASFGLPRNEVDRVRREVQDACLRVADGEPGFFRLTVPTGGGKTLASLAFALEHAERHGLERVIVAIPFTSIIEQTVDIFRGIFGEENVLEHHSAIPVTDESGQAASAVRRRLAAENWDCPLVVTTNVQLFESLLANKTSRCRKLHNIAQSVVVLDEAQSLPPSLIQATTDVLGWMVRYANCSVVFCTATQPDYSGIAEVPKPLTAAREIVPNPERLFERLRRVEYRYVGERTHEQIAQRMREQPQVLAVLNTKADAAKIFQDLGDDALYLSTWLCPNHRRDVLSKVRRRLEEHLPCRLVSTQVVEAGVDVDFPFVLRAMAPLDSLVQAAGRCNRSGDLPGLGVCEVFELEGGKSPRGAYRTAIDTTRRFIPARLDEVGKPALQSEFTRATFGSTCTDKAVTLEDGSRTTLQSLRERFEYPLVAKHSALIEEETTPVAVERYEPEAIARVLKDLAFGASPRIAARRLAPYSVSLRPHELRRAMKDGLVVEHASGFHLWVGPYDHYLGVGGAEVFDPEELMI